MTSYADEQMRQQYELENINKKKRYKTTVCQVCNNEIKKGNYCSEC